MKVKLGTKHFKIFQMLPFEKNQLKRRDELSRIYLLDESRRDSNLTVGRFSSRLGSSGFNVDYLKSRNILDTVSSIFNEDL